MALTKRTTEQDKMKSAEFWEGFHSARQGFQFEACPYSYSPPQAKEWKRGFKNFFS
ncbi:hypothetical protein 16Q_155 [Pseudomonas phage 16Q]|nr:hypothetical protein 16Q_155 [Pseudomonas phage 16Q]